MEKGKKQITHEEKSGVEQIGEDGKEWVKTAEGSVTTIRFSYSEIRVEVDTPWESPTFYCSSRFYWWPVQAITMIQQFLVYFVLHQFAF